MKLQSIILAVLTGFLVFEYEPPRPAAPDPNEVPFHYDPNQCPSEPFGYAVITAGTVYENSFKVTEPEGNEVTLSITTGQDIEIDTEPYTKLFAADDPTGKSRIYRYRWRWATTEDDIGLHYINVRATDEGGAYDERTFLALVKEEQPATGIGGCHRR
jgi:hypothetical protein